MSTGCAKTTGLFSLSTDDSPMVSGLKVDKMSEVSEFCLEKVSNLHISA